LSVRLDEAEVRDFLKSAHTGILTTLRANGLPISLPMWFVGLDGVVYVQTPSRSKKVTRIRGDSRVGFLIESGLRWAELKAVHLSGRAVFVDDDSEKARVSKAMAEKYESFRTTRSQYPSATKKHYSDDRLTIRIEAEGRVLSWDNAKIRLKPS
jgi:nitroimidazol reductase NimA-like FMN-containing flavoprotein (pyridoxamine 5'-phosphate oxidase superfamily)